MEPPKLALRQLEAEQQEQSKHMLGSGISKALPTALNAADADSPAPMGMGRGLGALADATADPDKPTLVQRWEKQEVTAAKARTQTAAERDELAPLGKATPGSGDTLLNGLETPVDVEATDALVPLKDTHIDELLRMTGQMKASDLHITVGLPPMVRQHGRVIPLPCEVVTERDAQRMIYDVLNEEQIEKFERTKELDFSYGIKGLGRYRFNVYRQRGCVAAAMRLIPHQIPSLDSLRLPPILKELTRRHSGLILVTGPTGSGKSTTIAAMIDVINLERECHIMTIEDPVEYLHAHKRSMVNQRELGADTLSFTNSLRAVLREDPDVILIGEMRDLETIAAAITLAETGHLVFGTLHTRSAPATIDRVVDVFPSHQQDQIRTQLSTSLESVVAQQLMPKIGGGRVAAIEVMIATSAIRNLIREGKTYQINSVIETGHQFGMQSMDRVLADLCRAGTVTVEEATLRCNDKQSFERLLKGY
jgi:twitching motility protein PilT